MKMTGMRHRGLVVPTILSIAAAVPGIGHASTITLSGTGAMSYTYQYFAPGSSPTNTQNDYNLAVPGQYTYTDTFTSPQSMQLATSGVGPYDFEDRYRFTIGAGANGDTLQVQLGLGNTFNISDLQFRIYELASPTDGGTGFGAPSGATPVTLWQASSPTGVDFNGLQSGTYILDIAGIANGSSGGTYVGQLNLTPVPLPAALWLLGSSVFGLSIFGRRKA